MAHNVQLLPCPFCGGTDLEIVNTDTPSFWVRCLDCDAQANGNHFPGPPRRNRFSYSLEAHPDDKFEVTYEGLYPEYQQDFDSAVAAWNLRSLSGAERDIINERKRQVANEGWSPDHDDTHVDDELALAATWYAIPESARHVLDVNDMSLWPHSWASCWFKPTNRRRDLVKAAALLIAEIDRLDRADDEIGDESHHSHLNGGDL